MKSTYLTPAEKTMQQIQDILTSKGSQLPPDILLQIQEIEKDENLWAGQKLERMKAILAPFS